MSGSRKHSEVAIKYPAVLKRQDAIMKHPDATPKHPVVFKRLDAILKRPDTAVKRPAVNHHEASGCFPTASSCL